MGSAENTTHTRQKRTRAYINIAYCYIRKYTVHNVEEVLSLSKVSASDAARNPVALGRCKVLQIQQRSHQTQVVMAVSKK